MSRGDSASDGTSYQRALHRMAALARFGMRPGLDSTFAALAAFDHPERAFPSLHVAGTNGKGSTSALAESMLRAAGATTGLYTSPHLQRFTERIRLGGHEADRDRVAAWLHRILDEPRATGQHGADLTFFEVATVAAFAAESFAPPLPQAPQAPAAAAPVAIPAETSSAIAVPVHIRPAPSDEVKPNGARKHLPS